jgi:ABC-type transport system involved in cytochrome c biogenesis permease subunit
MARGSRLSRSVPWIAGGLAIVAAAVAAMPNGTVRGFDLDAFGRLPVLEGGRVKPIDTTARNALLMIRGQQGFRFEGRSVGPDEWLLDVMFRAQVADRQPVFVVNDPDVLGMLGLRQTADRYFPFATLVPHLGEIQEQAQAAMPLDAKQRTRFQAAVLNLYERVFLYYRLRHTMQDPSGGLSQFRPLPPLPGAPPEAWRTVGEALGGTSGQVDPALQGWARTAIAWSSQDPAAFNREVAAMLGAVTAAQPEARSQADHEVTFNRAQPFYVGMVIYILAFLVVFASWLWKPEVLRPAAYGLLLAGAAVQTAGLVSRTVLQGRPPVTNLYSSAVFVGWGAVILGVVLERMYRKGFGTAVAAAAGFSSLLVAHHLTGDGDTMEMMRAVLDSNFWLATHVVTITIGYSGTYLAGAIAIAYALRKQLAPRLEPATTKALGSMAYGVVCFSLFFSFVGTVLGGIWADQSWGRFWGWDPKENGALLIVLWNAIILHARWGGYAREDGIMAMAIFGNVITSLSWFGVNMLGVGLHSYGFMDKAFWALAGFSASQLVFLALALLPRRFWRRAEEPAKEPQPSDRERTARA